jgi:glutamine cyclotransferase
LPFKALTQNSRGIAYFCGKSIYQMKNIAVVLLVLLTACGGPDKPNGEVPPVDGPKLMGFVQGGQYPHDTSSYTQGLVVYKGEMYEGTGNYGRSKLRKVDITTGKMLREIKLDDKYFGEGITILNDTVYQLTWKEKKAFAYTLNDFKKVKEFDIDLEGWGLTTDGKNLIASNGGSDLYYYEPSTFKLLKTQSITETGTPVHDINELEFVNGFIYANQYQSNYLLKIDPANGNVIAKADLSAITKRARSIYPNIDVLNGIAYDTATRKMYITGKWWPELYEVSFSE